MTKRDLVLEALRGHLVAVPALFAFTGQRIYQDTAPQNATHPNIVYSRINRPETQAKQGRLNLITSHIQLTIAGKVKLDVSEISDIVRNSLSEFRGRMGTIEPYRVIVSQVRVSDGLDAYSPDTALYYRHQDITIRHRYKED